MNEFEEIQDLMNNGNWSGAQIKFQKMNPTPREFQEYLDTVYDSETLKDWGLLGFYAREYTGGNS